MLSTLLISLLSLGATQAGCPTNVDWREFEGFCYWRSTYPATWSAAVSACPTVGVGSQLASIHSLLENSFVMQTYNYAETWVGLSDLGAEGQFAWSDGSDVDFQHWSPGQPDNLDDEDCVQLPHPKDPSAGRWDDYECDAQLYFVCKLPATA